MPEACGGGEEFFFCGAVEVGEAVEEGLAVGGGRGRRGWRLL